MHIDQLPIILDDFKSSIEKLIKRGITYQISERIDAAKFPEEVECTSFLRNATEGFYMLVSRRMLLIDSGSI